MGARRRFAPYLRLALVLVPLVLLLTGCDTGNAYSTLTDRGSVSERILDLFYPVFFVAVIVFFAVEGLLMFVLFRYRDRGTDDDDAIMPVQTHGNTRLEVGWTILPSVILAIIAVPTISTIVDLSRKPDDALPVRVVARQWWWDFEYDGPNGQKLLTANEMHIPAGRKVHLTIESEDVIHSFFVPNLAGKQDAVPNHKRELTIEAKDPGIYQGECAEFCLKSHALMRFRVIAQTEQDFNQWLTDQARPATTPTSPSAQRGQQVFLGNACIGCHAIEGTAAQGRIAPNLTHFGSRTTLGANRLENTPENVELWIRNPQQFKPGAKMPSWAGVLSDEDIRAIVDYLESLK